MDDDQLLLTVGETARLLRLSRAFTYDLVARGDLPVIRFGRRVLVPRGALERYLREKADGNAEMLAKPVAPFSNVPVSGRNVSGLTRTPGGMRSDI